MLASGVQVASSQPSVLWGLLKGGTSIIWRCMPVGIASTCFPFGGGGGRWFSWGVVPGTLLGPEGSGVFCLLFSAGLACWSYRFVSCLWGWGWRRRTVGFRPYFENYTVDASIFVSQVFKGARWMPWYQEPKKDVGICDKPRGVDNQTVIRGFPNGETRLEASPVTPA